MSVCITLFRSRARVLTLTISLAVFLACVAPIFAEPAPEQPATAEPAVAEPSPAAATPSAKADSPATDTAINVSYELTEAEKRAIKWGMIPLDYSQFPELKDLPRDDTGRINFVRAINDKYLKIVKAEDNAALDVLRIMGSDSISPAALAEFKHYYPEVVSQLPKEGSWVPAPDELFTGGRSSFDEIFIKQASSPWKAEDSPHAAAWINSNESNIKSLGEALKTKTYSAPLFHTSSARGIPQCIRPYSLWFSLNYQITSALRTRAMQRLDAGNVSAAWQDIISAQTILQYEAIDSVEYTSKVIPWIFLYRSQLAFANNRCVPSPLLKKWFLDIAKPDYIASTFKYDPLDDFISADSLQRYPRTESLSERLNLFFLVKTRSYLSLPLAFDANLAQVDDNDKELFNYNDDNSYAEKVASLKTALDNKYKDENVSAADIAKTPAFWHEYLMSAPSERRESINRILRSSRSIGSLTSQSMVMGRLKHEYELRTRYHLTRLAFLVAAFEQDKKRLPDKLGELVPDYIKALPDDPFVDAPLNYSVSKDAKSFSLWSVGPNLVSNESKEDDVAVTVQVAE